MKVSHSWYADSRLHVAVIMLIAGFYRLWDIGSIPPGLFGDEATNGLDALDILAGRGSVFFPANFGREGLHMWIIAASFRLLGVVPLALRLPSAVAGILTALATYWLGRELLISLQRPEAGGREAAALLGPWRFVPLVASLFLATSFWHVHFSRFGIRGVFTPLMAALAFGAFWRAINHKSSAWFAVSGACLGLSTHFYTASRFLPFFLGGFLLMQWLVASVTGRREDALLTRHARGIVLLLAVTAVVFGPLGFYFLQHPGSFTQRAGEVAALGSESAWADIARAAVANVLQFILPGRGDADQFYNLPRRAVFDFISAIAGLAGLGVLVRHWRRDPALFLLLWLPALMLPSFLATDRWPTLPRVLGVIPGVYFLPAIGLASGVAFLWGVSKRLGSRICGIARGMAAVLVIVSLGTHAVSTYRDYFYLWGPSAATHDAFEGDMTAAWRWLADHQPAGHVYLSSDIYRHPTFMLLSERASVQTIFQHNNPRLSWFDARHALPLPLRGETATYLITAPAPLADQAAVLLRGQANEVGSVASPDGKPTLTVLEVTGRHEPAAALANLGPVVAFTDKLALAGAMVGRADDGSKTLWLAWHTTGPDVASWPAYRLEIAAADAGAAWEAAFPFEAFRPPEWVPGGRFMTWHMMEGAEGEPPSTLSLRLIDQRTGQPAAYPGSPDGWHEIAVPAPGPSWLTLRSDAAYGGSHRDP